MNLTPRELELKNKLYSQYKVNKKEFIKDYGAEAEQVMVGRAVKLAKQMAGKEKIKEIIKKTLSSKSVLSEAIDKNEFKEKIKTLVKKALSKEETSPSIDLDSDTKVSLDNARFPVLSKFPSLQDVIVKLLTDQYDLFLKEIEWVSPRPTTFRIVLGNDQVFYLIYTDRTWIGKVEGKKYYLLNIGEEQNCIEAISRILSYGAKADIPEPKAEVPAEEPVTELPPEEPIK